MSRRNNNFRDWKEVRRQRALELKQRGWKQSEIAEAFGVSKGAVSQWVHASESDPEAWRAKPRGHRPAKLSEPQLHLIPDLLSHGAETYGFRGQLWTCARVAEVIGEEFKVQYHKAHVSRLLKALHWTPQLPVERASQRDEAAIKQWRVEVWPACKKRRARAAI